MSGKFINNTIILGSIVAVLFPQWIHFGNVSWQFVSPLAIIFPALGLLASSLLWLHTISGAFEEWLRARFDLEYFVHWTSLVILASFVLHPLLLLILIQFNFADLFFSHPLAISMGMIGFVLLITYDIGKLYKKRQFFIRNWNAILIISTVGFLLTFLHSLSLGSDLQSGLLRGVWIFYGVTALLATIYTYAIKPYYLIRR